MTQFDLSDFWRTAVEHALDGVCFTDPERRILYWNAAAARMTGYEASLLVSRSCVEGPLCYTGESTHRLCETACPVSRAWTESKYRDAVVMLERRDGTRTPVLLRAIAASDKLGQRVGVALVFSTIPEARAVAFTAGGAKEQELLAADPVGVLRDKLAAASQDGSSVGVLVLIPDRVESVRRLHGESAVETLTETFARAASGVGPEIAWAGTHDSDRVVLIGRNAGALSLHRLAEGCRSLAERLLVELPSGDTVRTTLSIGATLAVGEESAQSVFDRACNLAERSLRAGGGCVFVEPSVDSELTRTRRF